MSLNNTDLRILTTQRDGVFDKVVQQLKDYHYKRYEVQNFPTRRRQ